ncbi:short chain dehydrogenase reductase [Grosmannia clavigera kw1407]|uniref:Short chain dehydrogenase reductase n=1 Tax=Grosmannia clavigera (strain kw1407 / UAMH 11150) TaxID=655863 RepID=F0XD10_GROCL|nr:short chain dehydrogenase reductase [Grosmannia clavigera kw1407]EFX04541.1 short chain dehydrogenase reductase [Grosmannia clavigera kw1407]
MADRKNPEAVPGRHSHAVPAPSFPTHNSPRTWFLTQGLSPLAVRLTRLLLAHGDYVVACLPPQELADEARSAEFRELASECRTAAGSTAMTGTTGTATTTMASMTATPLTTPAGTRHRDREGWKDRLRGIRCDGRQMGQCAAAVAEAVAAFGRIDILLCCKSESVVGAVEELALAGGASPAVLDQFDSIFFSQVNAIKAALPQLRAQRTGHVVALSSVGGHIGMPGMPMHTAATAALEGYCDSLAYEIAPFNIKVTVVQPNTEVQMLTNRIVFAPSLSAYASTLVAAPAPLTAPPPAATDLLSPAHNNGGEPAAPTVRDMLIRVLNTHPDTAVPATNNAASRSPVSRFPRLSPAALDGLVLETVHALAAIGGHENPPSRHIVGFEASASVQDKLKTVTEELEDFVEASVAVDIFDSELRAEARKGRLAVAVAASGVADGGGMAD